MTRITIPDLGKLDLRIQSYIDQVKCRNQWLPRILLSDDDIKRKADEVEQQTSNQWGEDGDEIASQMAFQVRTDFEVDSQDLQIAQSSLLCVDLWHLVEQQLYDYVAVKNSAFEYRQWDDLRKEFKAQYSIDLECFPELRRLRLLANVIKHPSARDTEALRKDWPELFTRIHPREPERSSRHKIRDQVKFALGGRDLFLNASDYQRLSNDTVGFWEKLEEALHKARSGKQ